MIIAMKAHCILTGLKQEAPGDGTEGGEDELP